jgi:hypothetical protein
LEKIIRFPGLLRKIRNNRVAGGTQDMIALINNAEKKIIVAFRGTITSNF